MNMMVNILRFAVFLNEFELKKKNNCNCENEKQTMMANLELLFW